MNKFAITSWNPRNAVRNVCIAATVPLLAVAAHAQETDPFDTAMTTITTKVDKYGAALVGLAAVAVVFFVAMKYVKKIPRAS